MEPSKKEIIKKIEDYLNGKINKEEVVNWASQALDRTTTNTNDLVESALMDLWSLHDEWGVNKEELPKILQELKAAEFRESRK